ncbi:MAG: hypothetical protein BWK80_01995 [Desulfobacteraceae bacterium IS3]|nr:MAG: hypothetical protein BWK80_01995 [Desulfobacteraceae bacterium IS3]
MSKVSEKKITILIVDDNPKNIQAAAAILGNEGYDISFDEDGESALRHVQDTTFDLILLDIMMPNTDGYEVCRGLKENPDTARIPVIFLTARTDIESIVKGFEVGAADYVTKPFNEVELLARVKTHLKLKQSDARLRELNAAKDKFFSIISHDLKGSFNALMLGFDLLTDDYDRMSEDKKKNLLETMNTACRNTFDLLNNLLTWSRSQTGNMSCEPEIFDIREIVAEAVFISENAAKNKNIRIIAGIKENTLCYADMDMMRTVIRNLVANAVKYTASGGTVTISAKDCGDDLEISVSDTGVGIRPENIRKLFRIDVKHSTSGTAGEEGTGLGLNLCKEFVEKNSGEIGVESEVGKGSRFYFTCPKTEIRYEAGAS